MLKKSSRSVLILLAAVAWTAGDAVAQVFTPTFMAPRSSSDVGLYLSDGPGDFSMEGIWRRAAGGFDLGFRVGVADMGDVAFMAGAELRNPLAVGAPLDLAVTGSAQGVFGPDIPGGAGFLLGLSLGHTFVSPGLSFTPYLHPRVGPVQSLGRDFELDLLADFGFDVRIGNSLDLRFGVGFADSSPDFGVGLAWR